MNLRPYQIQAIEQLRTLMQQGCRSILYQGATGSGKTLLTAHMLHSAYTKGMRSWFIVHRKELIDQSSRAFKLEGLPHGIIAAGYQRNPAMRLQLAGVQTLARRVDRQAEPKLIVWDECHHIAAASWEKIYRRFPHAYHIGLTATPSRLDGRGLGDYFKKIVCGPSVTTLIGQGYLSKYKLYAPSHVNLAGVHRQMGDYVRGELSAAMDKPKITGCAVEHYKKYANGKRAIVFAVSIEHSKHIVEQFQKEGFNAAHVDGETDPVEREDCIRRFKEGNIQILSNVELFGEGLDIQAVEAAILLRPTESLGLYLQQVGRALRQAPGKPLAVVLDHVGNCERFGLPDQDREWSLEGRDKSKGDYQVPVRVCPACFGAQVPSESCIFCGNKFPLKPRTITQVAGSLQEIDQAQQLALKLKWKREQGIAKTYPELVALARQRGYKNPNGYAWMIIKARQKKLKEAV